MSASGKAIRVLLERYQTPRHHDARHSRTPWSRYAGGLDNAVALPRSPGPASAFRSTTSSRSAIVFCIADLKPSGKYAMEDLHGIGGTPQSSSICSKGLLDGNCLVTGKTLAETSKTRRLKAGQRSFTRRSTDQKMGTFIMGNLAPQCVAKINGKRARIYRPSQMLQFRRADDRGDEQKQIVKGDVVIIRPKAPGTGNARNASRRRRSSWGPARAWMVWRTVYRAPRLQWTALSWGTSLPKPGGGPIAAQSKMATYNHERSRRRVGSTCTSRPTKSPVEKPHTKIPVQGLARHATNTSEP